MGNACASGVGAEVTCGYMHSEGATGLASSCLDLSNGAWLLKWWAEEPGSYEVFVKIDGVHVSGSPMTALMTGAAPAAAPPPPPPQPHWAVQQAQAQGDSFNMNRANA